MGDSKLEERQRTYAIFRTTGVLPVTVEDLATVLSFEKLTTRIDLLHTTMKVAASLLASGVHDSDTLDIAAQIVGDFRDPLFSTVFRMNESGTQLRVSHHLMTSLVSAVDIAFDGQESATGGITVRGLASLITYSGSEADEEQFRKLLLNFNWLPEAIFLSVYPRVPKISEVLGPIRRAEVLTRPLDENLKVEVARRLAVQTGSDGGYLKKLVTPPGLDPAEVIVDGIPIWRGEKLPATTLECIAVECARTAHENGDDVTAIAICANASLENPRLVTGLPLADLFRGGSWKKVASYGPSVELCCSLHQYLSLQDERQIRTFKRFAIESLMRAHAAASVCELCANLVPATSNMELLTYFMTTVCDLPTLELLPGVDGSRQALKSRSEILRLASSISTRSSAQLISEADRIDTQLEVDIALDVLDDSKVYVDEEPLLVQGAKELAPDFERYKQLIATGVGEAPSLEELLRSVRQQSSSVFKIPQNEAEDLLIQMLDSLRTKFVDDPVNGLDTVIGRRIRHGTISGELRGTLEHLNMIGQRPRTGADYDAPALAIEIGNALEIRLRKAVNNAFARFSQAIDQLVAQLRDEIFQCAPTSRQSPAFELVFNPFTLAVARSLASQCLSVGQFARECFQLFWFTLSPTVERERATVDDFVKKSLRDIFSKLNHELRNIGVIDATALAKVHQASERLQYNASLISSWIRVPRLNVEGKTYPLPLVFDVALAYVKSRRTGFEPSITVDINDSVELDSHGFPLVHDGLQIAFDNIAEHSGIRVGNPVDVRITLSDNRKLVFDIHSDIDKNAWTTERSKKFEQIRDDISKRN
ncbi:hypothetical protein [Polaromonas sp.]|uniref:hypothetical protein n=1 Tax=Polaromonas sp. TaxID=1869339 RepID=UPI00356A0956